MQRLLNRIILAPIRYTEFISYVFGTRPVQKCSPTFLAHLSWECLPQNQSCYLLLFLRKSQQTNIHACDDFSLTWKFNSRKVFGRGKEKIQFWLIANVNKELFCTLKRVVDGKLIGAGGIVPILCIFRKSTQVENWSLDFRNVPRGWCSLILHFEFRNKRRPSLHKLTRTPGWKYPCNVHGNIHS